MGPTEVVMAVTLVVGIAAAAWAAWAFQQHSVGRYKPSREDPPAD